MEKSYKYIIIVVTLALAAWYVFSGNGPANQSGFSAIKDRIGSSLSEQRAVSDELNAIGTGIGNSADTANSIGQSNSNAERAISDAQAANRSSREIIQDSRERLGRCQSIIDNLQQGNQVGDSGTQAAK